MDAGSGCMLNDYERVRSYLFLDGTRTIGISKPIDRVY